MTYHAQQGDPYEIGYADFVMGRPCISPWAKLGYKAIRRNSQYLNGYMAAQQNGVKIDYGTTDN